MAKYCVKCGTQMQDIASFCPSCGQAVQSHHRQTPQQYQQPQRQSSVWGRFVADIPTNNTPEQTNKIIEQFMETEGFKQSKYDGEPAFRKGLGLFAARKYLKLDVRPGSVHIEAFIPMYLLRGLPLFRIGELNLDGPGGIKPIIGPKRALRESVDRLIALITAPAENKWF